MTADEWQLLWFTAWVSALSTVLILPLGLATAWLLARRDWPGKSLIETLVSLPLVMPPVATGLILLKILGERGAVGGFFYRHFDVDIAFTWRGVLIALAVMSFPLLVRSTRVAFEQVNPRLEQIARTLGASNARVFWTITLPLASTRCDWRLVNAARVRPGARRVRRDHHGRRLYLWQNGHAFDRDLPLVPAMARIHTRIPAAWNVGHARFHCGVEQ